MVLKLEVDADAASLSLAPGGERPVPVDEARIDRDCAIRPEDADAAAAGNVRRRRPDEVVRDDRMVNLASALVEADAAAELVVASVGRVVGDAAPGDRAVGHECAAAGFVVPVHRTAGERDVLDRRAALDVHATRIRVVGRRDLLDDRVVPALALEDDAVCYHQLRVDLEQAGAERDGPAGSRAVDRGLDRLPRGGGGRLRLDIREGGRGRECRKRGGGEGERHDRTGCGVHVFSWVGGTPPLYHADRFPDNNTKV